MRQRADLLVAIVLAVGGALAGVLGDGAGPIRIALAAPLVLVLPGFALTRLLFGERSIDSAERLLLTVGLSLACAALGGVLLNAFPSGLTAGTWAVLLCLITVAGCVGALVRERSLSVASADGPRYSFGPISPLQVVSLVAAIGIAGGGLWIAHLPVPQQGEQGYTLLWSVPESAAGASDTTVRVGVRNMEPGATQYTLRIMAADAVLQEFAISLQPVDEWQADVDLAGATGAPVEAVLYRGSDLQNVYRRTLLRAGA